MSTQTRLACVVATGLLCFGLSAPAFAQSAEMTADEITRAFENQKTRGLTLIPAPGAEPAAQAVGTTITGSSEPAAIPDAASPDTAAPETATVAYQAVAPEDQVNIQISFGFDSALMNDDQENKLATMCQVMKTVDVGVFQIIGHTDASGPAPYNESLSLLRAQEVKRHLVSECGIPENRLQAVGMGEDAPVNSADPNAEENRRVEFQALV